MNRITKITLLLAALVACTLPAYAGQKKLMTTRKAKVVAQRALVESVFGLKVKTEESVLDMVNASFSSIGESKTSATVVGINFDEILYDEQKDLAKATASLTLEQVSEQTGITFPTPDKKFTRVGFATSSPEHLPAVKAMRVAEIDAYSSLAKQTLGFDLESGTKVENYVLTSDTIKTKMLAALFLAELIDYGWDEDRNAFVTLRLDLDAMAQVLGQEFATKGLVEVTGFGATENDYTEMEDAQKPGSKKAIKPAEIEIP
jgi:hypothetical protein